MTSVGKDTPTTSSMRREIEIKTLFRDAVREGVDDLTRILNDNERRGKYKSQEELRESKLFVALVEERERLGNLIDSIAELQEKLSEVEGSEKVEEENSGVLGIGGVW
ncbi:hypothetical protein HOY82DRAFT_615848 [Tuber indicum]|nr:hypothetical protein HOY82DRAFT_615848 [Tuber indicum]